MFTSLETSFPLLSGLVQYRPLALWPFTDSGSPGILVKQIAPKWEMPPPSSNFLVCVICKYASCNLAMLNEMLCFWKSEKFKSLSSFF